MKNMINIVRKNEFNISKWSGGTTTELLIYPKNAKYNEKNFKWRLSTAKVNSNESIFTHLPNVARIIMVIEGKLALVHKNHHTAVLNSFEQDSFMGDWETKSFGVVRDFNLMMTEGCIGKVQALTFEHRHSIKILLNEYCDELKMVTDAFYIVEGDIQVSAGSKELEVNERDLIYITKMSNEDDYELNFYNKKDKAVKVIRSTIVY